MSSLALLGGKPSVTIPQPHVHWPPPASDDELLELAQQRQKDISIKGNAGPIGQLEETFRKFLEDAVRYSVAFNSGTSGLLAAYFGLGIGAGDEVIVPALTYHAAVTPLFILGAQPIPIDVDQRTWCIDPTLLEAAITSKTKAITVVHQWGYPADMESIMRIARKHSLAVIEDCSHAHGTRYKDQPVGTFGDVAVFSLQTNKLVFAGEGGILVTNSPEIHDRAILLGHYRDRARDSLIDPYYQQFWQTGYGLKLRMSPFNAVVALHSLAAAPARIHQRNAALTYLTAGLQKFDELALPEEESTVYRGAWYGFKPVYHPEKFGNVSHDLYLEALQAEGLEVKPISSAAFSLLPLFQVDHDRLFPNRNKTRTYSEGDFPVAEFLTRNAISLPTFTDWPDSKMLIDQYLDGFQKVHTHIEELKNITIKKRNEN